MACATLKRNLDWESMSQLPTKRRRCSPFLASSSTSPGIRVAEQRSAFGEAVSAPAKIFPELKQEIRNEVKRLKRRRQLRMAGGAVSSSSGSEGDCSPPHPSHAALSHHGHSADRALFTFKEVLMICERILREKDAALRSEYETALNLKLAEQYEAFVRFNLDQVQRRPPAAACHAPDDLMHQDPVPSYLS